MATKNETQKTNTLSIIGLITAFFAPLIGLILSIIGLVQINKRGEKGKGLAISGIVASVVIGLAQLVIFIAIIAAMTASITLTSYKDPDTGYSVQYPKGWLKSSNVDKDGARDVTFSDADSETGKSTGQVEVVYIPPPANGYSSDVITAIADSLKKDNQNTKVVYESRTKVGDLDKLTLITTYDGENYKVKAKTTIIKKADNSVLTVSTQTPLPNWGKFQDAYDKIHHTFTP